MSEHVVEKFRVVVARALAVGAPVDLQDLGGHGHLVRVVPEREQNYRFGQTIGRSLAESGE